MRGLDDLVHVGKVNYVGLSDAPAWIASQANTLAALRGWSPFVALQLEYTEPNLQIAREVDRVADELGKTSAQVAIAWARQRGEQIIPIVGVRKVEQLEDLLGSVDVELSADHLSRLGEASRVEMGFPYSLLQSPLGQMVYGDLEPNIELPASAPYRRRG